MTEDLTLVAYRQSEATQEESTRCLLAAFAYLGIPESLIDLGCGDGHLVKLAGRMGVKSGGVDINVDMTSGFVDHLGRLHLGSDEFGGPAGWLMNLDLSLPLASRCWPAARMYDMALCWEVAEHLPPESADTLCDTAVSVLAPGGVLLWSAATPGQGGAGHLNERHFHAYWKPKLERLGLQYDDEETGVLATMFATVAPSTPWYGNNLRILRKP